MSRLGRGGLTINDDEATVMFHAGTAGADRGWQVKSSTFQRRDLLKFGVASALIAAPGLASAAALDGPRELAFHNLHTGESLKAVFWDRGDYVPDALEAVNHVLRDFRTGDVHPIDPQLLTLLDRLQTRIDSRAPFQVISGYRSPKTNAMLHEHSGGVASKSLHMQGMAIDIRVPEVALSDLHNAALSLQGGGVGYYPSSDFVHVDVGRVRRWG
jgi:uncharacterized protein YcbK (DUF882 family)